MGKTAPATDTPAPAPAVPEINPAAGGSYVRQPESGELTRVEGPKPDADGAKEE